MRGNAGVGAFRKVYGGSKDNGMAPSHFRVANGNIIRKVRDFLLLGCSSFRTFELNSVVRILRNKSKIELA